MTAGKNLISCGSSAIDKMGNDKQEVISGAWNVEDNNTGVNESLHVNVNIEVNGDDDTGKVGVTKGHQQRTAGIESTRHEPSKMVEVEAMKSTVVGDTRGVNDNRNTNNRGTNVHVD